MTAPPTGPDGATPVDRRWCEEALRSQGFVVVRPGASCWVERCTTPGLIQVDYCEGEEPPPCP